MKKICKDDETDFVKSKSIAPQDYEFICNIGSDTVIEKEWLNSLDWRLYIKLDEAYNSKGENISKFGYKGLYKVCKDDETEIKNDFAGKINCSTLFNFNLREEMEKQCPELVKRMDKDVIDIREKIFDLQTLKNNTSKTKEIIERAFIQTDSTKPPGLLVDLNGLYRWESKTMLWELISPNIRLISEKDPTFIKEEI